MEMSRKHLMNVVEDSVRENLLGCVMKNEELQIFEDANVIIHKHLVRNGKKVIIISGGGSGHEPLAAGYVGEGFLTAAVAGNIFSAPSPRSVLKAIRRLASLNNSEVLLLVMNYTGDRLTFGLAKERALLEKFNVSMFLFGEDCAFRDKEHSIGRRGLAGQVFLFKIAGALNDGTRNAAEIKSELENIAKLVHTISISLTPCNIPGVGASFQLPVDQMEIGLGIHGEAGVSRTKLLSAKKIMDLMWQYIENDLISKNTSLVVLVNNLGGLSNFELNIICGEALTHIKCKGYKVERIYCGTFVTSFNMSGVSLTVIESNEKIIKLLDASGACAAWQCGKTLSAVPNTDITFLALKSIEEEEKEEQKIDEMLEVPFAKETFISAVKEACQQLIKSEALLNELDSVGGDSDCGSTLAKGSRTILKELENNRLRPSFGQLARISETVMGGTTGAVYSLLFAGASSIVTSKATISSGTDFWLNCITQGMQNISKYGLAKVGDRTLLDALNAIRDVLERNKDSKSMKYVAQQVVEAVDKAALSTASMKARAGRASYVDSALLSKPDPGAQAVAIWTKAVVSVVINSAK